MEPPLQASEERSIEHELEDPVSPEPRHHNRHRKRGRGRGRGRGGQLQDALRADPTCSIEAQSQASEGAKMEHELGDPVPPETQHHNRHRKRGRGRGRERCRQLQDALRGDPACGVEAQPQEPVRVSMIERDSSGTVRVVQEDHRRRSRGPRPRKERRGPQAAAAAAPSLEAPGFLPESSNTSDIVQPQGTLSRAKEPLYPRMDRRAVVCVQELLRGTRAKRPSRVRINGARGHQRSNTARRESDAPLPKVDDDATEKEPTAPAHGRSPSTITTGIMKSFKKPVRAVSDSAVSDQLVPSGEESAASLEQPQQHDAVVRALSPPDVRPAPEERELPAQQHHEGKNEEGGEEEAEEQSRRVGLVDASTIVRGQTTSPLLQGHIVMKALKANGRKPVEEEDKGKGSVVSHNDVVVEDIIGGAVLNTNQASTALVLTPRSVTSATTIVPRLSVAQFISLLQPRAVMRGLCLTAHSMDVVVCCPAGPRSGLIMTPGSMRGALVPLLSVWPTAEGRLRLGDALKTSVPPQPGKTSVKGVSDHTNARPCTTASKLRARFGCLRQVPRISVRRSLLSSCVRASTGTRKDVSESRFKPGPNKNSILSALRRCLPRSSAVGSGLSSPVTPPSSSSPPTTEHTTNEAFTTSSQSKGPETTDAWIDELLTCPVEAPKPKTKPSMVKRVQASLATALRPRVQKGAVNDVARADPVSHVDEHGEGQERVMSVSCWGFLCGTTGRRL